MQVRVKGPTCLRLTAPIPAPIPRWITFPGRYASFSAPLKPTLASSHLSIAFIDVDASLFDLFVVTTGDISSGRLNGVSVSRGSDRLLQEFEIADRCNVDMLLHAAMRPDIAEDDRKRICCSEIWRRVVATSFEHSKPSTLILKPPVRGL